MASLPTGNPNPAVPQNLQDWYLGLYAPQTGYEQWLGMSGLGGRDPLSDFARGDYSRRLQQYQVKAAADPGLSFTDYLGSTPSSAQRRQTGLGYLNTGDPTAGFYGYLSGAGYGGNRGVDQYARSQFSRSYADYRAQAGLHGSTEGFYDYLRRTAPGFESEYNALSPEQRGVNTSISMPRVRWNL